MREDFNIKERANSTGSKYVIETYNVSVTDNTLEIRLIWAGKGTTCIPSRGNYGPLISAISVCHSKLFSPKERYDYCILFDTYFQSI